MEYQPYEQYTGKILHSLPFCYMALCNKFASKLNNITDSQFLKEPLMHFDLIMIWHPIIFKENVLLSNVLNKIPLFKEEKLSTEMN